MDQTKGIDAGEYLAELHHARAIRLQFFMFPYPPLSPLPSQLSETIRAHNVKPAKQNKGQQQWQTFSLIALETDNGYHVKRNVSATSQQGDSYCSINVIRDATKLHCTISDI